MELIKAIKKQRILKRDILKFKQYIYRDKANANLYYLYDINASYIVRYDKDTMQFKRVHFDYLPKISAYYTSSEPMQYLKEFTTFKNEYKERQNTLNPRYDEALRVQVHTEYVNRKRFYELERYFNNQGE